MRGRGRKRRGDGVEVGVRETYGLRDPSTRGGGGGEKTADQELPYLPPLCPQHLALPHSS